MDIKSALSHTVKQLQKAKIKSAHLEAEILLSFIIKKPREYILAHPEFKLSKIKLQKFKKFISRRKKGEPIAYLTGKKEFYGLEFLVNKNVLIPRPETELMVEEVLEIIKKNSVRFTLIDVGTGSGCVIITLAKLLGNDYQYIGTDISKNALAVAKKNSRTQKTNIKFIKSNLLNKLPKNLSNDLVILANLPYGWSAWKNNSSADTIGLKFEPKIALFTGKNGLELYEELLSQLKLLQITSKSIKIFLEIDPRQAAAIKKLIKKYLPTANFEIKKDLKGHNRLVVINQ